MRLKRALRDERGFMSLGSAILGVVMILIVIMAFGGVTAEVLQTSTITAQNASLASTAKSRLELLVRQSAPLPTAAGNAILINAAIGNGWTWTETTADGAQILKVAIPKFGHTVSECQNIASTKSGLGRCVIADKVIRTDLGGMKITPVVGWTANASKTVLTVIVPAGWPTLRYYLPITFSAASMTIQISSSLGTSGTTASVPQLGRTTVNALGELETTGVAQTMTLTITGGSADTSTAIFYRGSF